MQRVEKEPSIIARQIVGKMLLIPVRGKLADLQVLYMLNATGEFIWGCLDGKRTADDIAEAVAAEFEVSREAAAADVREYLSSLLADGLVQEVPA